jgi:hypothetical protein
VKNGFQRTVEALARYCLDPVAVFDAARLRRGEVIVVDPYAPATAAGVE